MKITPEFIFFWGDEDPFSNFYPAKVEIEIGYTMMTFPTTEHAFMYLKAMYFEDNNTARKILAAETPLAAKQLGRQVKNFDAKLWDMISYRVMYDVNFAKYSKNPEFKEALLLTGDREIVEASPYDRIWGVGLGENDLKILTKSNWRGQNKLGKVLMDVRKALKNM
jgi:ribA/ribD-fused uncharacterized protein